MQNPFGHHGTLHSLTHREPVQRSGYGVFPLPKVSGGAQRPRSDHHPAGQEPSVPRAEARGRAFPGPRAPSLLRPDRASQPHDVCEADVRGPGGKDDGYVARTGEVARRIVRRADVRGHPGSPGGGVAIARSERSRPGRNRPACTLLAAAPARRSGHSSLGFRAVPSSCSEGPVSKPRRLDRAGRGWTSMPSSLAARVARARYWPVGGCDTGRVESRSGQAGQCGAGCRGTRR